MAVNTAALAEARGRHHESAVLLGAASRLRGTHDRTDRQVRELTRRAAGRAGRGSLRRGVRKGWELDGKTAVTEVDPARLSRDQRTR